MKNKHKIIATGVALVVLIASYAALHTASTTDLQDNKGLSIEIANKSPDLAPAVSTIAPAVSIDSPVSVPEDPTTANEGCPDFADTSIVTAHTWFTLSDAEKKTTKIILDGDCKIRQVINGEMATTQKIVVPFGSLFDLYVKGIETKDSLLLKTLSTQAMPKIKSVESYLKLYEIAPSQGWEAAHQITTLLNVPDFILSLREKLTEFEAGSGSRGFSTSEGTAPAYYLANGITYEPSANYTMVFIYLALGGSVDFESPCEGQASNIGQDSGKFYYSNLDGSSFRLLHLILADNRIGTKIVKKNGQNISVVYIQCKQSEII